MRAARVQAEHDAAEEARHAARQAAQRRSALDVQRTLARQVLHSSMRSSAACGISRALGHSHGSQLLRPCDVLCDVDMEVGYRSR